MLIALHKPTAACLLAPTMSDRWSMTCCPTLQARRPVVSSVGRLDRDTSGLLLLTDDGALLHRIISPRQHVAKVYLATLDEDLRGDEAARFARGDLALKGERVPPAPGRFPGAGCAQRCA